MTKPDKGKAAPPAGMEWAATLCFGTPAQPMHREGAEQFNRKSLDVYKRQVQYGVAEGYEKEWNINGEKVTLGVKKA